MKIAHHPSRPTETDKKGFVAFFWETLVTMIPHTVHYSDNTQQFFAIALDVFRSIDETRQESLPLASYLQRWSSLLLEHKHEEVCLCHQRMHKDADVLQFVGRDCIDWFAAGLTGLLQWCIGLLKSTKKPLNIEYSSLIRFTQGC